MKKTYQMGAAGVAALLIDPAPSANGAARQIIGPLSWKSEAGNCGFQVPGCCQARLKSARHQSRG
jgi:hypothetical protein